jgi:hypothetical protein
MSSPSPADREQFAAYLRQCTDAQLQGVYEKEKVAAKRHVYADLAAAEASRRGVILD